jgi:hypothetical protein
MDVEVQQTWETKARHGQLGKSSVFSEQQWEPGVGVKDTQNNRGWG